MIHDFYNCLDPINVIFFLQWISNKVWRAKERRRKKKEKGGGGGGGGGTSNSLYFVSLGLEDRIKTETKFFWL